SSDALVIWMLRMAMKAPIMLASTATQAVRLALSPATSGAAGSVPEGRESEVGAGVRCAGRQGRVRMKNAASLLADEGDGGGLVAGFGIDRGDHGHAGAQHIGRLCCVQDDFHGNALHHLCEVAGSIVGRQQRKLLPACRGQTVDTAPEETARIH